MRIEYVLYYRTGVLGLGKEWHPIERGNSLQELFLNYKNYHVDGPLAQGPGRFCSDYIVVRHTHFGDFSAA